MTKNKESSIKTSEIGLLAKRDKTLSKLNTVNQNCNNLCQEQKQMIRKLLTYIKTRQSESIDHYQMLLSNEEIRRLLNEYSV